MLLFVVLFYVYPLKFVFTFLISRFTGHGVERMVENGSQVATLMIIFGIGYLAVFGLFVLLYRHAYKNRERLELSELEIFDTRTDIRENTLNVGIAAVSIVIATLGGERYGPLSGMAYMLTPVIMSVHGFRNGRKRKQLEERIGFPGISLPESS